MLFRHNPSTSMMLLADKMVLFGSSVSCSNLSLITSSADATGIDVKSAVTSNEVIHFPLFYLGVCYFICKFFTVVNMCYVMQAVVSVSCLEDKCLSHAKLMSTALTQLLIFRFSYLLTNKGLVQCIDNSNYSL